MAVQRIVANVAADSVPEVREFYIALFALDTMMDLGWVVTLGSGEAAKVQMSIIAKNAPEGGTDRDPVPDLSIEVDDVDAVYRRAGEMGCPIIRDLRDEPWHVRRFFVADPTGKVVNVLSHRSD